MTKSMKPGFTLVELMIAVAIACVFAMLATTKISSFLDKSKAGPMGKLRSIATSVDDIYGDAKKQPPANGSRPTLGAK